jgi:outer membrane immunogenic protein
MKPIALLVAVSLGVGLGRHASAADLELKAPPAPPADTSWTGFYLGFHAGWGWASNETATASSTFTGSLPPFEPLTLPLNSSGAIAGAQLGYNWQFANRWVFGVEGDASGTGLKSSQTASTFTGLAGCGVPGAPCGSLTMTENVNWLTSARGRFGYTFGPGLAYVTGALRGPMLTTARTHRRPFQSRARCIRRTSARPNRDGCTEPATRRCSATIGHCGPNISITASTA